MAVRPVRVSRVALIWVFEPMRNLQLTVKMCIATGRSRVMRLEGMKVSRRREQWSSKRLVSLEEVIWARALFQAEAS